MYIFIYVFIYLPAPINLKRHHHNPAEHHNPMDCGGVFPVSRGFENEDMMNELCLVFTVSRCTILIGGAMGGSTLASAEEEVSKR